MKNDKYWANRMKILEDALLDESYDYIVNLEKQYDLAIKEIEDKLAGWYQRFASNNEIKLAEAKKMLSADELQEFKWTVEEYIQYGRENAISQEWMKQLENASARVHISRLDSIKLQLQQQVEELYGNQLDNVDEIIRRSYEESYYHTAFEIQKGVGIGWSLHGLSDDTVKKVLAKPWTLDKQTFSDRLWTNKSALINSVNTELTQMIMRGTAPDKAIRTIAGRFNVSKSQAGRLVMTESAAFANEGRRDCFNELGVEQYVIASALDKHTCELCGTLDGEVYKMNDYQVGITAPPFHPWCRCTTAPYFADMEGIGERFARDVKTGKSFSIPKDMTYEKWRKQFILNSGKEGDTDGYSVIEKIENIDYNDIDSVTNAFNQFSDDYKEANIEYAKVITNENKEYSIKGLNSTVGVNLVGKELNGAYVIHNHPDDIDLFGDCFSKADFKGFFEYKIKEMQVVSGLGRYSIKYNGEYLSGEKAAALYEDARKTLFEKAFLTRQPIEYEQLEVMKLLGKTLAGLEFKEIR